MAFDALVAGDLDLYVDYSGTVYATILERDTVGVDRAEVLRELRSALHDDYGIELLASLGFENTDSLAMRESDAEALDLVRISQLESHAASLEILGDYEFFERAEWNALESRYTLEFGE